MKIDLNKALPILNNLPGCRRQGKYWDLAFPGWHIKPRLSACCTHTKQTLSSPESPTFTVKKSGPSGCTHCIQNFLEAYNAPSAIQIELDTLCSNHPDIPLKALSVPQRAVPYVIPSILFGLVELLHLIWF